MFTSDTEALRKGAKTAFIYLLIAVFCALFGGVYERFSHGVYSYDMLYAFAYPLVGGAVPFLALGLLGRWPGSLARILYHCGIATLTVGSIIRGVLEIYGTTNALTVWYAAVGAALTFAGIVTSLPLKDRPADE